MSRSVLRTFRRGIGASLVAGVLFASFAAAAIAVGGVGGDTPILRAGAKPLEGDENAEQRLLLLDAEVSGQKTAGDRPLDITQVGQLRAGAAKAAAKLKKVTFPGDGPHTFNGGWSQVGPNPIVQVERSDNSFSAMAGRIGALAIRPSTGQFILGAAQGGIWLYDPGTGTWSPRSDDQESLAIGALAIAPSDDSIVYAGTGEGALSGDSQFGDGILRSVDGGSTWAHISGDYFVGVSVARIVVDPTDANHLYAAVLRGRGGAHRVSPPVHSRFGIWESKDGGTTWNLLKQVSETNGATDLEIDPLNHNILYASFWGDAIYKSTNGGSTWAPIMNGLPTGVDYAGALTRFSIAISHPSAAHAAVLYAGFDWNDASGKHHPGEVFKSTDAGASWTQTGTGSNDLDNVEDYCTTQCFYDNVIEVDPTNPDVVYAGGSFGYDMHPPSGGIFRSTDGGATWVNLGWDLHPDFHALAMDPANPDHVLIGNDGGVEFSSDRGGRPTAADGLSSTDWENLNGTVDPDTAGVIHRTNLAIGQFTSIATVPQLPARVWGGTQDNGTLRKSGGSNTWFDVASGDGGQVLVDPTPDPACSPDFPGFAPACFVYGTYFGISPYRYTDGGAQFFSNQFIEKGIDLSDRSEFYVPWTLNQLNPSQLFLGTYRLYRTDNARTASAADVSWQTISPDLTTGCTGTAPNGARACAISAIGVGGGTAAYVGTLDGLVWVSPDAQTADDPTWVKVNSNKNGLPARPVSWFAVDRSNYRIAYAAYNGYDEATPTTRGHVFKTVDGGASWQNITSDLPDVPVNSLVLDPSYPNTIYAATDVGTFVTYNGGGHWVPLGSGMPVVATWQIDLDPLHRTLVAGTHGRGAFRLADTSSPVPALVVSKADAGVPVGPSSNLTYTLTVRNIGNADATGVTITDPLPENTTFVSADNGGTSTSGVVTWSDLTIPAGESTSVTLTLNISSALKKKVTSIVNDGVRVTSAQGPFTTGSPVTTALAPAFAATLAPAAQTDGARAGESATYHVTITNEGFTDDSYTLSSSGGTYPVRFLDSTCTTESASTPTVPAGGSADVCVMVDVPSSASDGDTSTATVTATSVGSSAVTASGTVTTIAVTKDTLLVDEDGNAPDVQPLYKAALDADGVDYSVWDLATSPDLPSGLLNAHTNVVWFTGNSYPGPVTPYEGVLKSFLDGGGNLLMSGQDILDQAAGTTAFVHDYLHIDWDGSETQNDQATDAVHGVTGSPVTDGIGTVPLDHSVLNAAFEDQITPNGTAAAAFTDDSSATDALSFDGGSGSYKVVFLAFPLEAYGSATDKADLVQRVMGFFGS